MFSETQLQVIIRDVNQSINIPIMSESREGRIISKLVTKLNPHIEPSLRAILPDVYVDCLRIALTEGVSADDRRKEISAKLIGEIEPGLTRGLNDRIDSSLVPDMWEDDLLRIVSKKVIKEFVEWTVGSLDEQLSRSIAVQERAIQLESANLDQAEEEE